MQRLQQATGEERRCYKGDSWGGGQKEKEEERRERGQQEEEWTRLREGREKERAWEMGKERRDVGDERQMDVNEE